MTKFYLIALVCMLSSAYLSAQDSKNVCESYFEDVKKVATKMAEGDKFPECVTDMKSTLKEIQKCPEDEAVSCVGDLWKKMPEDEKKKTTECLEQIFSAVMKEMGDNKPTDECQQAIQNEIEEIKKQ